ncbi:ComF family protein [Niabella beijingensis]|uniref:ComF family protein n=1 Tax=Niabella beijingensis TaxID=2872700 RepID=UPI001CBB3298|nr:ComF family protein [Niabella beijingensis]MBZ4189107.1 ComF family protein [Niabella beijingensis]
MNALLRLRNALLQLFYPHVCAGCGTDVLPAAGELCLLCLNELPVTGFEGHPDNPVEKIFAGRLKLEAASAQYYFIKHTPLQFILHQFKYRGNQQLGLQLGMLLGNALQRAQRFQTVDLIVPMPLYRARMRKRGYNQAALLCEGIAAVLGKPVCTDLVYRNASTETQTTKSRIERWANMQGKFSLGHPAIAENRHLLLVDDVVTTGATLEACGSVLLEIPGVRLSVVTLCFASS